MERRQLDWTGLDPNGAINKLRTNKRRKKRKEGERKSGTGLGYIARRWGCD
jgi:hypothetical protein